MNTLGTHLFFAYIGPGAGFAFLGSFFTILFSLVASCISLLLWPFRMVWLTVRGNSSFRKAKIRKLIFLGLDGFDPDLAEQFMAEGKLPNLARLKFEGDYRRLRTTSPPLSPVAWATFATGVNPGKHNIFDFLSRDPRTYAPKLSSAVVRPSGRTVRIGNWSIPLGRPTVELRRKSDPFWKILGRHAIKSTVLRVPITFPPETFNGRLLSAMATPDLRGTQGTFSLFTSDLDARELEGELTGPDNEFLRDAPPAKIPFKLTSPQGCWELELDREKYSLVPGEYSKWIKLRFRMSPGITVRGIARFLLTFEGSRVSLYVTPIQIDPERPALPISQPRHYAIYLAKLLGSFSTLGLAEDTSALNEGALDDEGFLKQARLIQEERERMFFSALERTRRGVVACVFDTTDRVQHMFYRYLEPAGSVIEDLYRDMDRLVSKTLEHVDAHTALYVLSDHGFCAFRRGVNLNTWLLQQGYLHLRAGYASGAYLEGVDWSRTSAYAFGLSGIYLNLRGREARGIVSPGDAEILKTELIQKLTGLRDEATGDEAIRGVYDSSVIYMGPYQSAAPDLIVGYTRGYRASWDGAIGKVADSVFEDNAKAWSGDHCVDAALVPGVLFSNRKIEADSPGIEDMAPTALHLFGIEPPAWMEGVSVVRCA
ncbi:MAG: alkaline phosphatase family protein [Bryobacteraceae bacterium]